MNSKIILLCIIIACLGYKQLPPNNNNTTPVAYLNKNNPSFLIDTTLYKTKLKNSLFDKDNNAIYYYKTAIIKKPIHNSTDSAYCVSTFLKYKNKVAETSRYLQKKNDTLFVINDSENSFELMFATCIRLSEDECTPNITLDKDQLYWYCGGLEPDYICEPDSLTTCKTLQSIVFEGSPFE